MTSTRTRLQRMTRAALVVVPALLLLGAAVQAQATVHYKEVHYQFASSNVIVGNPANGQVHGSGPG